MRRLDVVLVLIVLVVGFHIRLLFMAHPGHTEDLSANARGSDTILAHGLFAIYSEYPNMVMPPLWQWFLWATTRLHGLSSSESISNFYLKLPGVLADLAIALMIFLILRKKLSFNLAYLSMIFFVFNPGIIYNSAYWGKWDSLPMVFVVASLYLVSAKRPILAWSFLALGVLVKLQILVFYPLFAFVTYRQFGVKKTIASALASALVVAAVSAPFMIVSGLDEMLEKGWIKPSKSFPLATVNAYNLWYAVNYYKGVSLTDINWYYGLKDSEVLGYGLTYKTSGLILFTVVYLAVLYYLYRRSDFDSVFYAAACIAFSSFMLPTRVHERYVLYAIPLLAVVALKDKKYIPLYVVASGTFFLNIWHVLATQYGYWGRDFFSGLVYEELIISFINIFALIYMLALLLGVEKHLSLSKKLRRALPFILAAFILMAATGFYYVNSCPYETGATYLSEMPYVSANQGYGILGKDVSVDRNPITLNGVYYCRGLGTHANSELVYDLSSSNATHLRAWIGVDDESMSVGKVVFKVFGDGKLLFETKSIDYSMPAVSVNIAIESVSKLTLIVDSDGSGVGDHADWADAKLVGDDFVDKREKSTQGTGVFPLFFSRLAVFLPLILFVELSISLTRMRLSAKRQLAVALLVASLIVQCTLSMAHKNLTYDEPGHIGGGYAYLKYGEFRVGGLSSMEHPPLVRSISALPAIFMKGAGITRSFVSQSSHFSLGNKLVYGNEDETAAVIFYSRLTIIFLSVILGLYVFSWSNQLFGANGGLLSLFLYVFSPNILAHSRLVTTDLGGTLFIFIAVYYLWKYLKKASPKNLVLAAISIGLALTSKISGILLAPIFIILFTAGYVAKPVRKKDFALALSHLAVFCIIGLVIVCMAYGFKDVFKPLSSITSSSEALTFFGNTFVKYVPIPLPSTYLQGIDYGMAHSERGHTSYFMGKVSSKGSWYYYLLMFLVKVPVAMILLLLISIYKRKPGLDLMFLAVPTFVVLAVLARGNANIGLRHILPVFPFLFVFVGSLSSQLNKKILIGLCMLYLYSSLSIYPHYLAYYNEFVGGPDNGYKIAVVSDLDWGQDLKGLSEHVRENNIQGLKYSKYGTADPAYYGLSFKPLSCNKTSGVIAIHAVNLMRDQKCNKWLHEYEPYHKIGYSIFLYNITE